MVIHRHELGAAYRTELAAAAWDRGVDAIDDYGARYQFQAGERAGRSNQINRLALSSNGSAAATPPRIAETLRPLDLPASIRQLLRDDGIERTNGHGWEP